jgi:RNA polymerase sigma factor (sigma-70 family)
MTGAGLPLHFTGARFSWADNTLSTSLLPSIASGSADGYGLEVSATDLTVLDAVEVAFSHGDETALRSAYDAHGSLIYTFCCRTLPEDRAKDVTQEVFVSAWRARDQFDRTKGSLAGWLIGIAKNRTIDNIRSEKRHIDRRSEADIEAVPIESEADSIGDRMLISDAMRTLTDRSRSVIELAYFDGLTHAEIAERTHLPLGTVKSDIRRGLERIRTHIGAVA